MDNTLSNRKEQAVFLQSGDPTLERRDPDSYSGGQLGQRFSVPDVHTSWLDFADRGALAADWQLVKTDSVMDVLPYDGAVAFWLDRAAYLVTTDVSAAGRGNIAGIFRDSSAPQDPTTHNIGLSQIVCIQKKGVPAVNYVDSPTSAPLAAGNFVIPSATDAKADALAAGTAATYPPLGKAASTATSHYGLVDLDVNDTP